MPRIESEIKLDFKDVLFRPKRSNLSSRSQVKLERKLTFKHSKRSLTSIPVIAANMDTVASFEMAIALSGHKMLTAIHKHYSVEEWKTFATAHPEQLPYVAVSTTNPYIKTPSNPTLITN